jgi:L-galactose dehydrogenase
MAAPAPAPAAPKLPRRPLGATGLEVSVIGFGASPLGSVFEVSAAMGKSRA